MGSVGRAVTILDVARAAGVSRQTVTRALNDMPEVSAATKGRVVAAAQQLNYRPNRAAQGLVRGRTVTVGLLAEDLGNPYYAELAAALTRNASTRSWTVVLTDLGGDPAMAAPAVAAMVERVDALLLTGCRAATFDLLPRRPGPNAGWTIPTVVLDGAPGDPVDAVVEIDHEAGISAALTYLISRGHQRIAMIDSTEASPVRRQAYRNQLHQHQLPWMPQLEVVADETPEGAADATLQLLERTPRPDAVLAYNDVMALGVLKALARARVRVPEDLAVIGVDGLRIGALVTPELTSLAIDKDAVARTALQLVDELLSGEHQRSSQQRRRIPLRLLIRDSA